MLLKVVMNTSEISHKVQLQIGNIAILMYRTEMEASLGIFVL